MADLRMRYDAEQVRERTDVLSVISQHVALKKRGGRYTGLCPFHQEKTPSFSVDPEKGFWHCFGCGKGGDAFNFVMQLEHLSFPEAVERLAERAGVRPIERAFAPRQKEERDILYEANALAAAAFDKALRGKPGEQARRYLEERGITAEQAARFGLGYAPAGWDALVTHLQKQRFTPEVLVKAGLALTRTHGDGHIDRFRNRLMIPIHDRQGRVVAFGGRALAQEDTPKYLNTAETPIFHKSRMLYALNLAADSIARRERAIITEGYFDAIACHLAGFTETVATLGTALGEEHVQLLRRLAERVYLVFDADSAGITAALRSQRLFREADMDVRIVRLPAGHDPDTLLRHEGTEAFEQCLAAALTPVDFELERLLADHPITDAASRVRFFRAAAKILQPLSKLERAEYAVRVIDRALGARGDISELQQALLAEVATLDRSAHPRAGNSPGPSTAQPEPPSAESPLEREVIVAMVQNSDFAMTAIALVPADAFTSDRYRRIFVAFADLVDAGHPPQAHRIVSQDESLTSALAAMVIREPLPLKTSQLETMLDRLLDEYGKRLLAPCAIDLDERDKAQDITQALLERSERAEHKSFSETTGQYVVEPMDDSLKARLGKYLTRQGDESSTQ